MDPVKVQGVMDWPQPMKVKDVQSFIGFVNFYQRFIRNFSEITQCHGMTSLPPLCPPLPASNPIHLHSTPSAFTLLQLQSILAQLIQLHCAHSRTNHRPIPDPFGPGSHAKGHHLYTLSTFVLFA